jgi:PAS domain S-box-containing protein
VSGNVRLLAGGVVVGALLAAMVLAPYTLYLRAKSIREKLQDQVDFVDVSLERAAREVAHRERQLRLHLSNKDQQHLTELKRSSLRIRDLLLAAERQVPPGHPDWASSVRELRELAERWEQAAVALVSRQRSIPPGEAMLEEARGRPGPIYDRYREQSSRLTEALHAERLGLQSALARIDLFRTLIPVPLALLGAGVLGYVMSLSMKVARLHETSAAERQRLAAVLEQMTDPVVVADSEARVFLANASAKKLLRIREGDRVSRLVGLGVLRRTHEPIPLTELPLERALEGDSVRGIDLTLQSADGELPVSASSSAIVDARGNRIGAVMVLRDLSDRARSEDFRLKVEKLAAVAAIAERIAHDFGNILEGAGAATAMLGSEGARGYEERQRWAGVIRDAIEEARSVLDSLRTLAFTSTKRPELEACDADELIQRASELARLARPDAAAAVDFTHQRGNLPPIRASRTELLRSFVNVITNALDAMPKGGKLSITSTHEDGSVVIRISDTGIGIPDDQLERIFDLYFTTKRDRGSGLGLTTAREVIMLHGGSLSVRSELGKGSEFTVRLPAQPDAPGEPHGSARDTRS